MMSYTLFSFDEIKSTSDLLKEHFSSFSHFTIIKTNYQYKGRGQYERTWTSNRNENILFSLLLNLRNII
jgi:biotin-(acetyl-CoA carboxylase) ligase